MQLLRFLIEFPVRVIEGYERLSVRIAPGGFHKAGFYLSTFFAAPLSLRLWRQEIPSLWRRVPARLLAYALAVISIRVFFVGPWVFFILVLLGRLFRWCAGKLGFDESREPPSVPGRLGFPFTRLDRAALIFAGVILLIFFLNRSQLMPKDDSDHNYHMAVARQILERGEIPQWDDWEYAPAGRPHLYPPALHVMIAFLAGRAENVARGFETLQVITYPLALLAIWWFARWLFGARMGLVSMLVFSMDMLACGTMIGVLPSAMVTAFMPLLFMCFLTKRKKMTILLLALAFYTHTGMPVLITLGLFLFAVRHRGGYYPFFKSVLSWTLLLFFPWFSRVLPDLWWMGMPSTAIFDAGGRTLGSLVTGLVMGVLSLQFINPILLILGIYGLKRFDHPAAVFLRHMLVGFLPLLILYGGRYWMHTAPMWAVFTGSILVRFVPVAASRLRILALTLCTIIPLPALAVGMPGGRAFSITISVGGGGFTAIYAISPRELDSDFLRLASFIEENTKPREIVHVDPLKNYLGDRIVTATGRRVDVGGWAAEVRDRGMKEVVEEYRRVDTDCLFIYQNADVPAELRCTRIEKIGRFSVGIRGKTRPLNEQKHPPEPERGVRQKKE